MDEDKIVCQKCGAENPATNNFCSKCAAPLRPGVTPPAAEPPKKKKKKGCLIAAIIIIVLIIIIIVSAYSCSKKVVDTVGSAISSNTVGMTSGDKWEDKFDVSSVALTSPDSIGVQYVTGTIKNKTNKEYSYLQVEFNEYDASGAQVGSALANINNLEANGTWKFKAAVTDQNVKTIKLKDVTGF